MFNYLFVFEIIGTTAFAVAGAMIALRQHMDLLGVIVLGVISACGGGVLRDIMMGSLPPIMFQNPVYALTAIIISVIIFLPGVHRFLSKEQRIYDQIMLYSDALGLGVFTAAGVAAAIGAGYYSNIFFCIFLGVLTGVGGGVIRDNLAGQPPYIFVKHIYACASLAGAVVCAAFWELLGETASTLLCCAVVIVMRALAAHYRWSLPKSDI